MAKVILLVRVSTDRQEIETQKNELVQLASSDGYDEGDMIIIEGVGASAIKLNDVYLAEIDNLYQTIQNDTSINAVYAWEISRIGRNEEVLMRFKNFLIERKIQLVIKNPSLRLLNNDGSVNTGVELAFSLFATMSKQEMEIKKDRFARAKARNKAEGKYNGGKIKLGYKLDDNKYFIIDDEKAQVIRQSFDWYVNGMSLKKIYDKLVDMGIYSSLQNFSTGGKRVGVLLRDKAYTGEGLYPQIVDVEVFNKAQEILSNRHKWHDSKNIYFCKGLIKDTKTGATLTARRGTLVYYLRHKQHSIALNLNTLDYIAPYCANLLLAVHLSHEAQSNKNDYKIKIEQNNTLIKSKEDQIKAFKSAIDRAIEMNIMHPEHFTMEKLNQLIKKNETIIKKIESEIIDLQTDNTRMKNLLTGKNQFINQIKKEYSDEKKKEIIDSIIDRIEVTKIEPHHFKIVVKNKTGYLQDYIFDYRTTGHKIHVEEIVSEKIKVDITPIIAQHKRFERKR